MPKLSDIERTKSTPKEYWGGGFICYCEECEMPYGSHEADTETGLICCDVCGNEFQPEET